ncbi:MAG: hypothetical protein AB7G37_04850 [Solirubrobacteraceae bacterium]
MPAVRASRPTDLLLRLFLPAIGFLLASAVAAVLHATGVTGGYGRWLALHLALLGGVSQLVLGAGQFFATTSLATGPPPPWMARVQATAWSVGAIAIAVAVPTDTRWLLYAGTGALLGGLVLFSMALRGLERRSRQEARWAVRWYHASALSLGAGAVLGVLLARDAGWPHGDLAAAHLVCNLAGWLGTAIVGTLQTFYPSLTHTPLRHPRLQAPTFVAWTSGVVVAAIGHAFDLSVAVAVGWAGLAIATVLLALNVVGSTRAATIPLGLPARLVGSAQGFLVAATGLATATLVVSGEATLFSGSHRALLVALLLGWVGLTVAGSLLHLLTIVRRVRHLGTPMPPVRPDRDRWTAVAAVAATALVALARIPAFDGLDVPARIAVGVVIAGLGARVLAVAAGALRRPHRLSPAPAPPRPR